MSPIIRHTNSRQINTTDMDQDAKYRYPNKLDLSPDSDLHKKIVTMVLDRAHSSYNFMSDRHDSWEDIDRSLTAYIPLNDEEKALKDEDETKPVSVVIPVSYAVQETVLTFLAGRYLADKRIFRYQGNGPEDVYGAILLELAVMLQSLKGRHGLALHTWFRDATAKGFGIIAPQWTTKKGRRPQYIDPLEGTILEGMVKPKKKNVDAILFEGHELVNINPYRYFPDPNVPIHEPQRGEYVGWVVRDNLIGLMRDEKNGDMFNVKHLRKMLKGGAGFSSLYVDGASELEDDRGPQKEGTAETTPVDTIWMYIDLVPAEWELGKKDVPEKWLFAVSADGVVTQAKPMNLNHNQFPVAAIAPNYDGYTGLPTSLLEMIKPLNDSINWYQNSHQTNQRKGLNDMWLVDPSRINMMDLRDPEPGKLIRLRKAAWGRDVGGAVQQFPVNDVTRQNIQDMGNLMEIVQRVAGINDNMQSQIFNRGERVSAAEVRSTQSAGVSRLEKMSTLINMQGFWDLADMIAAQTQQFMSEEIWTSALGDWEQVLAEEYGLSDSRLRISPKEISINYDVIPADPGSENGEYMQDWVQMLQVISGSPEVSQMFDIPRIVMHIARLGGAKNVHQFRRKVQPQIVPDQVALQQAQAGNIAPAGDVLTA